MISTYSASRIVIKNWHILNVLIKQENKYNLQSLMARVKTNIIVIYETHFGFAP